MGLLIWLILEKLFNYHEFLRLLFNNYDSHNYFNHIKMILWFMNH